MQPDDPGKRIRRHVLSGAAITALGGLLFGYDTGVISYLVDYGLSSTQNWRLMFGLAAVPAVLMFTGMLFQRVIALAYFQRQVPETRNRSLQDIERELGLPEATITAAVR